MAGRSTEPADLGSDAALSAALAAQFLTVLGGFHPEAGEPGLPKGAQTLLLLGPQEPGFWPHLTAEPEWDGAPDPVDRWSRRVIGRIACDFRAKALFPFGGPPYHPFYQWALRTGRAWASPVRLLVHADQGLMVSFRGALALKERLALPPARPNPCVSCAAPCLTACPVGAMALQGYDVTACHSHLDQHPKGPCLSAGCLARRACPAGAAYARLPEQSAYHMERFHGSNS